MYFANRNPMHRKNKGQKYLLNVQWEITEREFLECLVFCSTWYFPNTVPIDFNRGCDYSTFQQWVEQGSWKMRMKYIMKYEKLIQVSWRTSIKHCSSSNRIWLTQRNSVMLSGDFLSLLVVFCHVPYMYFKMCVCIYAHIHTHTLCVSIFMCQIK